MLGRIDWRRSRRARRLAIVATALVFAAIGAHSISPRELYHQMYPLEPVKQDAFRICDDSDPTFVRAVGKEREACYNKMPHVMAVAMGRVKPGGALSMEALTDPSREAELLLTLASMPPQQPITVPRSFSNTAWVRALTPTCDAKPGAAAIAYAAPGALPPPPGSGRAAALDSAIRGNLPPLPRPVPLGTAQRAAVPVITLAPAVGPPAATADRTAAFTPAPAPDIGDVAPPAIVPLAPANATCGGA